MTTTHNLADFTSYMRVSFNFDNGVKVFYCETDAQRIETNNVHFVVFTNAGEEVHYPVKCVSDIRVQLMMRVDYHQAHCVNETPICDSKMGYEKSKTEMEAADKTA